jgi:uroporphyrinogen-III synthase
MQNKIEILCTGQLDESIVQTAAEQGFHIDQIPLIGIRETDDLRIREEIAILSHQTKNIVFTSGNAVKAVLKNLQNQHPPWSIYCIGNTTGDLVSNAFGLNTLKGTASSSAELAEIIAGKSFSEEVIFFCGNIRREELPDYLRKKNIPVRELTVYETSPQPRRIEKEYQGILFFSPSEAKSFFSMNKVTQETILFAIGHTTAGEIKNYTANNIIVSSMPGKQVLVTDAIKFFLSRANSVDRSQFTSHD